MRKIVFCMKNINQVLLLVSVVIFLLNTQSCREANTSIEKSRFEKKATIDPPVTYSGKYLTGIDFPVGALGGSVIRMNGKAERRWWQIFNNYEERGNLFTQEVKRILEK